MKKKWLRRLTRVALFALPVVLILWLGWKIFFVPKNAYAFADTVLVKCEIKDVQEDVITLTAEGCDLDKANQAQLTNLTSGRIVLLVSRVEKDNVGTKLAEWELEVLPLEVKTLRLPRQKDGKIVESVQVRKRN